MINQADLPQQTMPHHIAIIMDGNGRWAQQRRRPRTMGHKVGIEAVQAVVRAARELELNSLTLYAFSTENWQRPPLEIQTLMSLLNSYLKSELTTMVKNNVRLRCIGQPEKLPHDVRTTLNKAILDTNTNTGLNLNLALSYGSRNEIIRSTQKIAQQCIEGVIKPEDITEHLFNSYLDTGSQPEVDLLIRTGGESRLSNFLLWQASYAEIYITDTLWPDFRKQDLILSIHNFQQRQRRFGKTSDQIQNTKIV